MKLEEYLQDPTVKNHPVYQNSLFSPAAAEYSTGEVILASVYRRLLLGVSESEIDLEMIPKLPARFDEPVVNSGFWDKLMGENAIGSPSSKRSKYRQLMPIVPQIANFAGVLGAKRNRWNPSNLFLEVIGAGAGKEHGEEIIKELGKVLEINSTDDVFARYLEKKIQEISDIPTSNTNYVNFELKDEYIHAFRDNGIANLNPAERFIKDLEVIIKQKTSLTRRQWTVLLEASLRLGLGTHLLWICKINSLLWKLILDVCEGKTIPTSSEIEEYLWNNHREKTPLLQVGSPTMPLIEHLIREYLVARFGINILLCQLDEKDVGWNETDILGYSTATKETSPERIFTFLKHVYEKRMLLDTNPSDWLRDQCTRVINERTDLVKIERGFTKNMKEFIRHSLCQIDAKDQEQTTYDQAYLMRFKPSGKRHTENDIILMPGPAMLIALVNSCYHSKKIKLASLEDLRMHFADYGLHVPSGELLGGQVGKDLQKLGLVVDSPDAAGGRLLVPPFGK